MKETSVGKAIFPSFAIYQNPRQAPKMIAEPYRDHCAIETAFNNLQIISILILMHWVIHGLLCLGFA
jgi:hypothetical protein